MPTDPRNSLGFLNLQLRQSDLQRQQQAEQVKQQFDREAQQQDFTNALSVGKQLMADEGAKETRKIALAQMLQKASEANAVKLALEAMKEKNGQPLNDAKVEVNKARAGYLGKQGEKVDYQVKTDMPHDNNLADQHQKEIERENIDKDIRERQEVATKALTARDAMGNSVAEVDPLALSPGVGPAASSTPGTIKVGKKAREKAQEGLIKGAKTQTSYSHILDAIDKSSDKWYGALEGGTEVNLPFLGKKNIGINSAKDLATSLKSKPSKQELADQAGRQEVERNVGGAVAQLINDLSGASSNEGEAARIRGNLTGIKNGGIFSVKRPILRAAIQEASDFLAHEQEINAGIAEKGEVADPRAPKSAGKSNHNTPEFRAKAEQMKAENPQMSFREIFDALDGDISY